MWILPTYCRPDRCREVLDSLVATGCSTQGVVVVNGRDAESEYRALTLPPGWTITVLAENRGFAAALNATFEQHPNEPFYGYIADDEIASTHGWDRTLIEAAGDWRIANGNDRWNSEARIQAHVCIGGALARAVGCLAIKQCWHWYAFDDMWEAIHARLDLRVFCGDVRVDHRHFLNGGAFDMTYAVGGMRRNKDRVAYATWRTEVLPQLTERVLRLRESAFRRSNDVYRWEP